MGIASSSPAFLGALKTETEKSDDGQIISFFFLF